MDHRERVQRMAASGIISHEQAERLLSSLETSPAPPRAATRRGPWLAIGVGITCIAALGLVMLGGSGPDTVQDVATTLNQPGSVGTMNRNLSSVAGLLLLLVIPFLVLAFSYNGLVNREEAVIGAWSDVESTYQRRADLVPRLVETVGRYLEHEAGTLTAVTDARSDALREALGTLLDRHADSAVALAAVGGAPTGEEALLVELGSRDAALREALSGFRAVAEAYPDLRSADQFLELQAQLEGTENRINIARLRFNDAVQDFNAATRRLPGSLVAGIGGFQRKAYFKAAAGSERAQPLNL